MAFSAFDLSNAGNIKKERMISLFSAICKSIERTLSMKLPYPFDTNKGIKEWIQTAYSGLQSMNEPMNLLEYHVVGKSSPWALCLFTYGCFQPDKNPNLSFPLPPNSSRFKRRTGQKQVKSTPNTPQRDTEEIQKPTKELSNDNDSELRKEIEKMQKRIKYLEKKEKILNKRLNEALETNKESQKVSDDEWTDSDGEEIVVTVEETMEEQNERLIIQVRSLQEGLKKFMNANSELKKQNEDLEERNQNLIQIIRKYKQNFPQSEIDESNVRNQFLSTSSDNEEALLRQIDDYHTLLSWSLQVKRVVQSGSSVPTPPKNTQKVEIIMKRGDIIKNWKKTINYCY